MTLTRYSLLALALLLPAFSAFGVDYVWIGAGVQTPERGNGAPTFGFGGQGRWWYAAFDLAAYSSEPDNFSTAAICIGMTPLNFASESLRRRGIAISMGLAFTLLSVAAKVQDYGGYYYYDPYYEPETESEFHVLGEALVRVPFLKIGRGRSGWPDRLFVQGRVFGTPFEDDLPRAFTGFAVTLGWQGRVGW